MISALPALQSKYPTFVPIFVNYILGLGPIRPDNPAAFEGSKHFLHLTKSLYDSTQKVFSNTDDMKNDFENAFRFVKHYFFDYKNQDKIIIFVGPIDGMVTM